MLPKVQMLIEHGFDLALLPDLDDLRRAYEDNESAIRAAIIRELNYYWIGEADPDVLFDEDCE